MISLRNARRSGWIWGVADVENREIERLTKVSESGAVSQKTLLERKYAKEKLEVLMNAQREALRLRGLSERQIDDIAANRHLLRDLQIVAPSPDAHGSEELKLSRQDVRPVSFVKQDAQQDSTHVVLKSDGSIFPGDVVAQRGAHQMQVALKYKSGGGADPHAGHNH